MLSKHSNCLTEEEKELILKMHNKGFNTVEISKHLNRNNSTIGRFLKKNNLKPWCSKCKLLKEDKDKIIELYSKGLTAKEILSQFSDKVKSENTIMSIVKSVNIGRNRGQVCDANCNYFETIDSEAKAYFLGLFLTDGNVHKSKRGANEYSIQIALQAGDKDILENFKREIHSSNKVRLYSKNNRNECMFAIHSQKMAADLFDKGICPNKTFKTELNYQIPKEFFRHYIRGIFDGDGTVFMSNGYLRFGFYGTHKLVTQIQSWLGEKINISQLKIFDKPTVSFVIYQKKRDVVNFYNLIYKDANFYLKRKKDKFDNYFQQHCVNTEITKWIA